MSRDIERELNEWDGNWPACWRPKEGETLVGTIRMYSTGQSVYGPVRTVIVERSNGERVSLWLSSTVLLACFQQQKPKVGERIGLKYLGKHPEKGYRRYRLVVDREEQEPNFSPLGGEADAEPEPLRTTDRAQPSGGYQGSPTPFADKAVRKGRPPQSHRQPVRAAAPAREFGPPGSDDGDPFSGF